MFGQLVAAHRRRLGLTQEELAERTGLSGRTIRALESDRGRVPRAASVRLLADSLGIHGADREAFHRYATATAGQADPPLAVPVVAATATGGPPTRIMPLIPAQLPPVLASFVGRGAELARLNAAVADQTRDLGGVRHGRRRQDHARGALGAPGRRTVPRRPAVREPARVRPGRRCAGPGRGVRGFLARWALPPEQIPAGLEPGRPCTAACWPAAGCWSCWTTPATPTRCGRCCPARRLPGRGHQPRPAGRPGRRRGRPPVTLDLLTAAEARELCARRLGADRVRRRAGRGGRDRRPVRAAAAGAGHRGRPGAPPSPASPLAALAAELRDAAAAWTRSPAATRPPTCGRCSPGRTARSAPRPARLFRLLGLHPGPDIRRAGGGQPRRRAGRADPPRPRRTCRRAPHRRRTTRPVLLP